MTIKVDFRDRALGGPVRTRKMQQVPRVGEYVTGDFVGVSTLDLYLVIEVLYTGEKSAFVLVMYSDKELHNITGEITW